MIWEYECPECGAQVSSGFADPVCPMPRCDALLILLSGPEPTDAQIEQLIAEVEEITREDTST